MQLSLEQKKHFYDEGYVVVPGVVPDLMIRQALRAINHSLGVQGMNKDDLPILRSQTYCREVTQSTAITNLANRTLLLPLAESLAGHGNLPEQGYGQIGLRFPSAVDTSPPEPQGHLDGIGSGLNGSEKGTYHRGFTMLAVLYLNDVPEPYGGNFTVWPRSHRFLEEYFKEHGVDVLLKGMPQVELPEPPVQITGKAGDVCFTHHQVVHSAAPNASANIRYGIIYRLRHKDAGQNGMQSNTNIWMEFPGIQEILEDEE
jgi:hypothetical protein